MLVPLVDSYCVHLQAEGVSPHTIRWHQGCLRSFVRWLGEEGHPDDPNKWSATMLRGYIVSLQRRPGKGGKPFSAHSVQSYVRSLRAFCRWLVEEGFADADPMAKVKQPKAPALMKPTVSADDLARLLDAARAGRTPLRDEAILLFMLDSGTRAAEVCAMTTAGVDWSSRMALVHGKGGKQRFVPFGPQTAKAMQKYALRERKGDAPTFFQSEEGTALTTSGLLQLCQRLGKRAGVPLNPHKLRHTFCTTALCNGASVFAVQRIMGHTTLDVTMRYAALVTADLQREHEKHSPVAALTLGRARTRGK